MIIDLELLNLNIKWGFQYTCQSFVIYPELLICFQQDGQNCAVRPTNSLIFAHRVDIRQISLDVPYIVDVVLPLPPLKNAIAVDVDRKTGKKRHNNTAS